jgi:hypothetical protein
MPFGVFQRKVAMHQVLNNATEFIRGWTPKDLAERHGMSPLMSLEGDGARFFHVISSKIVGGHATFQVQMVGKADVVRTWDAKHMGYAFEAAHYDAATEFAAMRGHGAGAGTGAQGSDETNQRLETLRREQAGLDKLPAPELRRDFNGVREWRRRHRLPIKAVSTMQIQYSS